MNEVVIRGQRIYGEQVMHGQLLPCEASILRVRLMCLVIALGLCA